MAQAPLATIEDLSDFLGDLSPEESRKASLLLRGLSVAVRRDTGQIFTRKTSTVDLRGNGERWLMLPQQPATEVADVVLDGSPVTEWALRNGALIRDKGWCETEFYTITFTHGHEDVPSDVKVFVLMAASEAFDGARQLKQEQVGPYARTFLDNPPGEHLALGLRDLVRRYNVQSPMVRVG